MGEPGETEQRRDWCPDCDARRTELVVAPGRFYCPDCAIATPGPNEVPPIAEGQLELEL